MIDFHSQLAIIPEVYESAHLQDNLEHSGGINISWKSATDAEIPIGSYITYDGIRYILLDPYAPTKQGAIYYQYSPQFRHPQNLLDRTPFWIKTKNAYGEDMNLSTTTYTGFPYVVAQKLVDFFAEYVEETEDTFFAETVGTNWTFNIPEPAYGVDTHAIISASFDGCSIKSAADAIANAMGCNVFFDWNTDGNGKRTIRFVAGTTISGETYNCFHVLGGTTNMAKTTTSGGFAAVTQRLTLPSKYKGSIIDKSNGGVRMTKDLILDEIFPKMELRIKAAYERLCYLTDDNGDRIVDHYDGETPYFKTFAKWYVELEHADGTPYVFDQSKLILDQPLALLFQVDYKNPNNMSKLVGRQYELTYFREATTEWDTNDVLDHDHAFTAPAGSFRMAFEVEGEAILPTTSASVLYPEVGDKVTLINMALSDEMKVIAQNELEAAANEIISLMETPSGEYTETMIFQDEPVVQIGQDSPFGAAHGPVVTNLNLNLDTNVAEVSVGSWSRKTKTGGIADKVETVTVTANSATNGGDAYGSSLGEGHYAAKYKTKSESKLTSKKSDIQRSTVAKNDILFAVSLSAVTDIIPCNSDNKVKADTNLYTLVSAYYGSNDVTDDTSIAFTSTLPNGVEIYQVDEEGSTDSSHKLTRNRRSSLEGLRWLRIFIPKDTVLANRIAIAFTAINASHSSSSRYLSYVANPFQTAENMARIDLDNEADVVACDSEGKPRFARTIVTKVKIYDGNDVATSGVTKDTSLTPNTMKIGDCTPTISEVVDGEVTITWAFTTSNTISHANKTISLKYKNRTYSAVFSLAVIATDVIYQLNPSLTALNFVRKADNTFDPTERVLGLSLTKYDGGSVSEKTSCPQGYTVKWAYDTMPTLNSGTAWTSGDIATIQSSTEYKNVCMALYYGSILVDRETIPILKDGKDGENVVRVDLDNNNDTMLYSSSKGLVSGQVTSRARLYDGAQDKTANTSWKITAASGVTLRNEGNPINTSSSEEYDAWITTSGMVYVNGLNAMTGSITVQGTYTDAQNKTHTKYDVLTLKKIINGDKYDLVIEPNSIPYNKSVTWTDVNVSIKANMWSTKNGREENIALNSGGIYVAAKYKTTASGTESWNAASGTFIVNDAIAANNSFIIFELRKGKSGQIYNINTPSTYSVEDTETIPINTVQNGNSIYKLSEEDVKYQVDKNGTTVPTGTWYDTKQAAINAYNQAHSISGSEWAKDTYMWTRTTIMWSDTSSTPLYSAERNPNDGIAGQGIIVDRQEVEYSKQSSGSIDPSTLTYGSYPTDLAAGDWLYIKTTIYYKKAMDNTAAGSSVSYNVQYQSPKGINGRGLTGYTEHYKASSLDGSTDTQRESAPTDDAQEWGTNPNVPDQLGVSQWNETNRYLWNYERIVYTESNGSQTVERTTPRIIAIWTKDGKGIDSIVNYYLTNNIASGITKDNYLNYSWSTSITPTSSSDPYLWNYEVITYTVGDPVMSDPCVIGHYGKDGAQGKYEYKEYAISSSSTSYDNQYIKNGANGWSTTAPAADVFYPFYWMRTCMYDPATSSLDYNWSYVRLTGDKGSNGANGLWYRYAGVWGVDINSVENTDKVGWYVNYNDNWYMNVAPAGTTNYNTPGGENWTTMESSFKYFITDAVFANQAYLGAFVINGKWMISQDGTGSSNGYTDFHPNSDNTDFGRDTSTDFIPNFAVCGTTGKVYMGNAEIRGNFSSIDGCLQMYYTQTNRIFSNVIAIYDNSDTVNYKPCVYLSATGPSFGGHIVVSDHDPTNNSVQLEIAKTGFTFNKTASISFSDVISTTDSYGQSITRFDGQTNTYSVGGLTFRTIAGVLVEVTGSFSGVTKIKIGETEYTPTDGVVSLPAYPTSLPASDVYSWAKAESKPTYTASEVGALPSTTNYVGAVKINGTTYAASSAGATVDLGTFTLTGGTLTSQLITTNNGPLGDSTTEENKEPTTTNADFVCGAAYFRRNVKFNFNTWFNDDITQTSSYKAKLGDVLPASSSNTIGTSESRWASLYLQSGSSNGIDIGGSKIYKDSNSLVIPNTIKTSGHLIIHSGSTGIYLNNDGTGIDWHDSNDSYVSSLIAFASNLITLHQKVETSGDLNVGGTVTQSSDMRYKDVVENRDYDIDIFASAPLFKYRLKGKTDEHIGTSAQYFETEIPEAVSVGNDGKLSLEYQTIATAGMITAAREIVRLKETVASQQAEIDDLKRQLQEIKNLLLNK